MGVDLTPVGRVKSMLERYPQFRHRCFTPHEREYADRFQKPERRFAARFAGKEAVMKSLGTGWRRLRWTDIEITGGGRPRVNLSGSALRHAQQLGVSEVQVTITHTDDTALVMALALGEH